MAGHNYYLLASLPPLGEPGSVPPMSPAELLERVGHARGPRELLEVLFLGADLVMREALLAGELTEAEPFVLAPEVMRNEAPLPPFLVSARETPRKIGADDVWEAYFVHAAAAARRRRCAFLRAWVAHEVTLRNALAAARAKALDLDPGDYIVAPELADPDADTSAAVNEWSAAATPLAGLRALDAVRWAWMTSHDGWFTFSDDEVTSYGAKLLLLARWQRLAKAEADNTKVDQWKEKS